MDVCCHWTLSYTRDATLEEHGVVRLLGVTIGVTKRKIHHKYYSYATLLWSSIRRMPYTVSPMNLSLLLPPNRYVAMRRACCAQGSRLIVENGFTVGSSAKWPFLLCRLIDKLFGILVKCHDYSGKFAKAIRLHCSIPCSGLRILLQESMLMITFERFSFQYFVKNGASAPHIILLFVHPIHHQSSLPAIEPLRKTWIRYAVSMPGISSRFLTGHMHLKNQEQWLRPNPNGCWYHAESWFLFLFAPTKTSNIQVTNQQCFDRGPFLVKDERHIIFLQSHKNKTFRKHFILPGIMNHFKNFNDDPYEPIPFNCDDEPGKTVDRVQPSCVAETPKPRTAFNLFFRKYILF